VDCIYSCGAGVASTQHSEGQAGCNQARLDLLCLLACKLIVLATGKSDDSVVLLWLAAASFNDRHGGQQVVGKVASRLAHYGVARGT